MKEIKLTRGKVTLVDDEDFERLSKFKWYAHRVRRTYYADRLIWLSDEKKQLTLRMNHSIIGKPPIGFVCDHIDGNGLNNQRENLRIVTHRQNAQNKKNITTTSQYPGVGWFKRDKKWRARIKIRGVEKHLGLFDSETDAFNAYSNAVEAIGEKVI